MHKKEKEKIIIIFVWATSLLIVTKIFEKLWIEMSYSLSPSFSLYPSIYFRSNIFHGMVPKEDGDDDFSKYMHNSWRFSSWKHRKKDNNNKNTKVILSTISLGIQMVLANVLQKYCDDKKRGRLNVLVIVVNVKSRYDDFRWFLMWIHACTIYKSDHQPLSLFTFEQPTLLCQSSASSSSSLSSSLSLL